MHEIENAALQLLQQDENNARIQLVHRLKNMRRYLEKLEEAVDSDSLKMFNPVNTVICAAEIMEIHTNLKTARSALILLRP